MKKTNTKNKRSNALYATKKALSLMASLLIIVLGLATGILGADAEEPYESNRRLCETAIKNLGDAIEGYSNADTSEDRQISQKTSAAILSYRRELLELQSDPLFTSRSFEKEIALAEAKGLAIGEITWVFRSRLQEYPALSSSEELKETVEKISAEIDTSTIASVLKANIEKYVVDINRSVFCELVRGEGKPGDSLTVNAIIEGSVNEINKLYSAELTGNAYRSIYEKAKVDISLRRTKDKLTAELGSIYNIILPNGNFSSDKHVALFVYQLEEKNSIEEMNSVLNNTISGLLDTLSVGKYTSVFTGSKKDEVSILTNAASQVNSAPSLRGEFSDFEEEYARASAKDKIAAMLLPDNASASVEMKALESAYNSDGGIIDLCENSEELAFEIKRAKLRGDWYTEYSTACEEVRSILSPHDPKLLLDQMRSEYNNRDVRISVISYSEKNAEILTNAEFAKGVEAFEEIKGNARIQKFTSDHSEIISKSIEDLRSGDKQKLKSAIEDAIKLESSLLSKLSDITKSLAKKYKIVLKAELSEKSFSESASHLWKEAIASIGQEIDSISESASISDFYATAARISERAQAIEKIINRYSHVATSEEYKDFPDSSKTAFINSCSQAVDVIINVNITPISWSQRLSEALENSSLIITRSYSAESLRAMASKAKSADASPIAEEAALSISKAIAEAEINTIYQNARFKLKKILNYEEVLDRAQLLKKEIKALEYLTEERKDQAIKKLSDNVDAMAEKIKVSPTAAYLESAYAEATNFLDSIENEAKGENLKAAKRLAEGQLATASSKQEEAISGLTYSSAGERSALKKQLSTLKAELLEKIDSAKDLEELSTVTTDMEKALGDFEAKTALTELDACRRDTKEAFRKILEKKEIFSAENYNLILSCTKEASSFADSCTDIDKILENKKAALEKIDSIPDLLDTEKALAITSLNDLFAKMKEQGSLYSKERFATLEKLYESAKQSIEAIIDFKDIDRVEKLLSSALKDMALIPLDRLYTADGLILSGNSNTKYPLGYSISENGYPAFITAEGKIPYNSSLKLLSISSSDKQSLLRKLIRGNKVLASSGVELSDEAKKELKGSRFLLGFELDSSLEFDGTRYSLSILLPDNTNKEKLIGVVRLDGNESAEFYNFAIDGSLLTISIDSPGQYYLATEKNDLPLILAIVLIILLLIPICYFVIKYMRNQGIPPFSPKPTNVAPSPISALQPISDTREVSIKENPKPPVSNNDTSSAPENPTEDTDNLSDDNKDSKKEEQVDGDDQTVTIDEELLFGTFIKEAEPVEILEKGIKKRQSDEANIKMRRAEINLDRIAAHFKAGEVVTLEAMIKKGLIPEETTFVKVLARGKINKPLTIIAQDFSAAAMRMILLAGGNATITEEKLFPDNEPTK